MEWRDIPGYEGYYQVSEDGQVKSLARVVHGVKKKTCSERLLKSHPDRSGYLKYSLRKDFKTKQFLAHRLVWMAFRGPIPPKYDIDHMDGTKDNNHVDNLQCLSKRDHINLARRRGTIATGDKAHLGKLTQEQAERIRELWAEEKLTGAQIGAMFGVHKSTVSAIVTGRTFNKENPTEAHARGYNEGHFQGYQEGLDTGYQEGFKEGYEVAKKAFFDPMRMTLK